VKSLLDGSVFRVNLTRAYRVILLVRSINISEKNIRILIDLNKIT
jgi:hypothetical protein